CAAAATRPETGPSTAETAGYRRAACRECSGAVPQWTRCSLTLPRRSAACCAAVRCGASERSKLALYEPPGSQRPRRTPECRLGFVANQEETRTPRATPTPAHTPLRADAARKAPAPRLAPARGCTTQHCRTCHQSRLQQTCHHHSEVITETNDPGCR